MTFQEYLQQEDPQRQPIGSVEVVESDCFMVVDRTIDLLIILKMFSRHFTYLVEKPNSNLHTLQPSPILWSMDENGNKKDMSVFKLIR